ncbi:hypothetical protein JYU34_005367 [Plutella xylostella]|uniref:Uncharacterized protein n=1 Tax=Plutella xylostella TaxID=51655 RepID=A0ABQ7QWH3_PLUXY|nr:hypothetical protein JYU34_005367 [Plutella xylostella]
MADGLYAPSPLTVILSNLRRTVVALSNPATPRAVQEEFYNNSTIPGARWVGRVLENPDDIIHADYSNVSFKRDLDHLNDIAVYLERNLPKMAGGSVDLMTPGNQTQCLSNEMENLRVSNYTQRNLKEYVI